MDQIHEELMEPENELNQEEEEAMETEDAGSNPEGSSSNLMSVSERASSTSQGTIHILRKQRGCVGGVGKMLTFAYIVGGWVDANGYVSK